MFKLPPPPCKFNRKCLYFISIHIIIQPEISVLYLDAYYTGSDESHKQVHISNQLYTDSTFIKITLISQVAAKQQNVITNQEIRIWPESSLHMSCNQEQIKQDSRCIYNLHKCLCNIQNKLNTSVVWWSEFLATERKCIVFPVRYELNLYVM
jgi:hypothetical protein